jgi:hypothetical protein
LDAIARDQGIDAATIEVWFGDEARVVAAIVSSTSMPIERASCLAPERSSPA